MNIKYLVFTICFCVLAVNSSFAKMTEDAHKGTFLKELTKDDYIRDIERGVILNNKIEQMIIRTNHYLVIYQIENNNLNCLQKIIKDPAIFWGGIGDMDNDGIDEIIEYRDRKIVVTKYHSEGNIKNEYKIEEYIHQLMVGDINNDSIMEILVFANAEIPYDYKKEKRLSYSLYVYQLMGSELKKIGSGDTHYGSSAVIPPDKFGGIVDIDNTNVNRLVIEYAQSDVSATTYDILKWNNGKLDIEIKGIQFYGPTLFINSKLGSLKSTNDIPFIIGSISTNPDGGIISSMADLENGYVCFRSVKGKIIKGIFYVEDYISSQTDPSVKIIEIKSDYGKTIIEIDRRKLSWIIRKK